MTAEIRKILDQLPEEVREAVGQGLKLRLSVLKKLHKALDAAGITTDEVDEEMDLIGGTKDTTGLLTIMGVVDDSEKPDPLQEDLSPVELGGQRRPHAGQCLCVGRVIGQIVQLLAVAFDVE